jgi:hypothetical protein
VEDTAEHGVVEQAMSRVDLRPPCTRCTNPPRRAACARCGSERGTTLIETVFAIGILMVVMIGLLGMAGLATALTENQGHLNARTTEYAQDKMEQLFALAFGDGSTNTAIFPAQNTGGTGLGGAMAANAVAGSSDPSVVVAGYVDWLAENGDMLTSAGTTAPTNWYYKRVWQITAISTTLKQITVTTSVRTSFARAILPKSTITALKTSPF